MNPSPVIFTNFVTLGNLTPVGLSWFISELQVISSTARVVVRIKLKGTVPVKYVAQGPDTLTIHRIMMMKMKCIKKNTSSAFLLSSKGQYSSSSFSTSLSFDFTYYVLKLLY